MSRRASLRISLLTVVATAAGFALGMTACEPSKLPSRVPGDSNGLVLNVPYPMADAERIEGAGRQALRGARFVFIGGLADRPSVDHALPDPDPFTAAREGPVLIAEHIEPVGPQTARWQRLRRIAFGRVAPPREAVAVEPERLAELELAAVPATVWLVGPKGTCRATVGPPRIGAYQGEHETLAVGYRLDGCSSDAWAQIGIIADTIPVDFRWVPAEHRDSTFAHGEDWDDPLAAILEAPGWSYPSEPELEMVHVAEIPGATPRVVQLHRTWTTEPPEAAAQPWCEVEASWSRADGWYNERWLDPIPWDPDAVGPYMLGAFVNGSQVDAVLYDDRLDGLVVVPPGPLDDMDDPDAWRQVFVPTGRYAPEALAAWGIQPVRGSIPIGPACLPAEAEEDRESEPAVSG